MRTVRFRSLLMCLAVAALVVVLAPAFVSATGTGNQGCTPGYWKNHTSSWQEYTPSQKVGPVFGLPTSSPVYNTTLLQALQGGGGSGVAGARTILLRAAVAAILNAAHDNVGYPLRRFASPPAPSGFVPVVRSLLTGTNRQAMLDYASYLDRLNKPGLPTQLN
jgi:hypothetical protein